MDVDTNSRPRWAWYPFAAAALLTASACGVVSPTEPADPEAELRAALRQLPEDGDPKDRDMLRRRIEVVARRHPSYLPAQLAAADIALDQRATQSAMLHAERALLLSPDEPEALAIRARLAVDDADVRLAEQLLDRGLRARPGAAILHETRAFVMQVQQRWSEALASLRSAERLGTPAWRVAYNRGLVHELAGDVDAARAAYEACSAARPDFGPAAERLAGLELEGRATGR